MTSRTAMKMVSSFSSLPSPSLHNLFYNGLPRGRSLADGWDRLDDVGPQLREGTALSPGLLRLFFWQASGAGGWFLGLSALNPHCCGGDRRSGRLDRWTRGFQNQQPWWGSILPSVSRNGGQISGPTALYILKQSSNNDQSQSSMDFYNDSKQHSSLSVWWDDLVMDSQVMSL